MDEPPKIEGSAGEKLERIEHPVNRRLIRMRYLSRLLDTSIGLPGGYRIGIDPIIGLVPGIGDVISSGLSVWLVYDAARLGISKRVLARMVLNVVLEAAVGVVPLLGDIFDAAWKANVRNMRLVEASYNPALKERSFWKMIAVLLAAVVIIYGSLFLAFYLFFTWVFAMFGAALDSLLP